MNSGSEDSQQADSSSKPAQKSRAELWLAGDKSLLVSVQENLQKDPAESLRKKVELSQARAEQKDSQEQAQQG